MDYSADKYTIQYKHLHICFSAGGVRPWPAFLLWSFALPGCQKMPKAYPSLPCIISGVGSYALRKLECRLNRRALGLWADAFVGKVERARGGPCEAESEGSQGSEDTKIIENKATKSKWVKYVKRQDQIPSAPTQAVAEFQRYHDGALFA